MSLKAEKLLRDAGRSWEVFIGWVCALVSVTFAGLLVWLLYLVYWRNPREYGVTNPDNAIALGIFGVLLVIAIGFSAIAFKLIGQSPGNRGLLSPLLLRVWGAFFWVMSVVVLVDAILSKRGSHILPACETFITSVSMVCAAFVLARRRDRSEAIEKPTAENTE
jgi:peptidoglycan biosynthesis protein MviN/MurJ (putative lipid II flippase)